MIDITTIEANPIPKPTKVLLESNLILGNKNTTLKLSIGIIVFFILVSLPYLSKKLTDNDKA
jgi:hypothetical protein